MLDPKKQYNVWFRIGNEWNAVLNLPVSQITAETLAVLLAHESEVPYSDYRFAVSIHKPTSQGFEEQGQ